MKTVLNLLPADEYYPELTKKNTIYLHHTAGSHNPINSINGWDKDFIKNADGTPKLDKEGNQIPLHVGTSYVIGGKSTSDGNVSFDGVVYKTFEDMYWAHHLGTDRQNNKILNQQSVGIEICNYGPLKVGKDGQYYNYVNKPVPVDQTVRLGAAFKNFSFFHRYTNTQLQATKELLQDIATRHSIDLKAGLVATIKLKGVAAAFDINMDALNGRPGLYTHVNVIKTKFDCHPQQELIDMLMTL